MIEFLKFLGYLAMLLLIVPLAGLCVTGSWKQAWRYSRDWGRVIAATIVVGALVFLVVFQFMPSP